MVFPNCCFSGCGDRGWGGDVLFVVSSYQYLVYKSLENISEHDNVDLNIPQPLTLCALQYQQPISLQSQFFKRNFSQCEIINYLFNLN